MKLKDISLITHNIIDNTTIYIIAEYFLRKIEANQKARIFEF
jgi:hypothetical protein